MDQAPSIVPFLVMDIVVLLILGFAILLNPEWW